MDEVAPQKIKVASFYGSSVPRPTAMMASDGKDIQKDRKFAPDGPNAPFLGTSLFYILHLFPD